MYHALFKPCSDGSLVLWKVVVLFFIFYTEGSQRAKRTVFLKTLDLLLQITLVYSLKKGKSHLSTDHGSAVLEHVQSMDLRRKICWTRHKLRGKLGGIPKKYNYSYKIRKHGYKHYVVTFPSHEVALAKTDRGFFVLGLKLKMWSIM